MKPERKYIGIVGFIATLALLGFGCGGGGGDGDVAAGGGGISYTGLTTLATVDEDNAVDMAFGAYLGYGTGAVIGTGMVQGDVKGGIAGLAPLRSTEVLGEERRLMALRSASGGVAVGELQCGSETFPGDCGGSEYVYVCVDDVTGSFDGYFQYTGYCYDGVTTSGRVNWSGLIDLSTGEFLQETFSYQNITMAWDNHSCIRAGTISYDYRSSPTRKTYDMLHCDNSTGLVYWARDYIMNITYWPNYVDNETVSGRYYDPEYGCVEEYTEQAIRFYYGEDWPFQGVTVVEGETGIAGGPTRARLIVVSSTTYRVEADTDGDGVYDWDSGELDWPDL